jgi:hypothetical protein
MITQAELIDLWLLPEYGVTFNEVVVDEQAGKEFFNRYPVSQEAHDKWDAIASDLVRKVYKMSKKRAEKAKWSWYLNTAPTVKQ